MANLFRFLILLAAVCVAAAAPVARIEPSRVAGFVDLFVPKARGKDYELRMAAYRGEALRTEYIVRRRGDWARVERRDGGRLGIQQIHLPTGVVVERGEATEDGIAYLGIRAPERTPDSRIDYASRPTNRFWKAAGQKCRIWDVYRGVEAGRPTFTRFGCITRDGIEVARWTIGRSGGDLGERVTGYYLYRGSMAEADVRPAPPSLEVSGWFPTAAVGASDEVVLKGGASSETVTIRRRGGRTLSETINADGSRDIFVDGGGTTASARIGPTGAPESYIVRRGEAPELLPVVRLEQAPETILGQTCDWFDAMPYVADAGRHECRTTDGLVLAIRKFVRGGRTELTATSIDRRPLADAEILPPAWMFDLRRWGVAG